MKNAKVRIPSKLFFKLVILFFISLIFQSCASKKIRKNKAETVVNYSMNYLGTPYAWGGNSAQGIDCSGLIYNSFNYIKIQLPRTTTEMAKQGKRKGRKNLKKGDLVFFNTAKRGRKINHVGIVVDTKGNEIRFIHASTSRGVIISSLNETYWRKNFKKARRIL